MIKPSQSPNWSSYIKTLEHTGLTQREIAKRVGVAQSTVAKIKTNPEYSPSWNTGNAIIMCVGELNP